MTTKLAEHTQGPWRPGTMQSTGEISVMKEWDWTGKAICRAVDTMEHARLIAAAPALLEALEACLGCLQMECPECDGCTIDPCSQCRAKAAIRAAVGEQEENTK